MVTRRLAARLRGVRADSRWIEVADADGSGRVAVTDGTHWDHSPAWSPDGTRLLFNRDVGATSQLFRVAASGGKPQQLTYGLEDWHNGNADWMAGDLPSSPAGSCAPSPRPPSGFNSRRCCG